VKLSLGFENAGVYVTLCDRAINEKRPKPTSRRKRNIRSTGKSQDNVVSNTLKTKILKFMPEGGLELTSPAAATEKTRRQ